MDYAARTPDSSLPNHSSFFLISCRVDECMRTIYGPFILWLRDYVRLRSMEESVVTGLNTALQERITSAPQRSSTNRYRSCAYRVEPSRDLPVSALYIGGLRPVSMNTLESSVGPLSKTDLCMFHHSLLELQRSHNNSHTT